MKKGALILLLLVAVAGLIYGYFNFIAHRQEAWQHHPFFGQGCGPAESVSREVDLFFADSSGRRLALERREITGTGPEGQLRAAIEELIKGPTGDNRVRTLPETTHVRAVFTRDTTVWVDLGSSIIDEHPGGAWTEVLTTYSIVNTITENFSEVEQVQILIDGREKDTLAGHVDISTPLPGRVPLLAGEWE